MDKIKLLVGRKIRKREQHYEKAKNPNTLFDYNFEAMSEIYLEPADYKQLCEGEEETKAAIADTLRYRGYGGELFIYQKQRGGGRYSGFKTLCKLILD